MSSYRARILPPYTRRLSDRRHMLMKAGAVFVLIGFAMLMGFWLGVFGTLIVQPFVMLLGLLFLIALWMADDTEPNLRPAVQTAFLWYLGFVIVWPGYLAVTIPGLPWITPTRLLMGVLALLFLLQIAQSREARDTLVGTVTNMKLSFVLLGLFWVSAFATTALSKAPGPSLVYTLQFFILWSLTPLIALWLFTDGPFVRRAVMAIIWCSLLVFVLTVFEAVQRKPIWFGHIPSFLQVEGPLLNAILQQQMRLDGSYRARGVFAVHLYYSQYLLMVLPFLIHFLIKEGRFWNRMWVAALTVLAISVVLLNNTRTATTGMLVVIAGSVGMFALRRFLKPRNKADMTAPAIFVGVMSAILVAVALISASPRLQTMTIGGSQHKGSDRMRELQWERATDALMRNPLGYGGNSSGPLAGRLSKDSGVWIIDSAWINLLLDYGVIGVVAWAGFLISLMVVGVLIYIRQFDEDSELCGPAAMSIGAVMMTMYSISFFGNMTMLMMIGAMICGTAWRLRQKSGVRIWPIQPDAPVAAVGAVAAAPVLPAVAGHRNPSRAALHSPATRPSGDNA